MMDQLIENFPGQLKEALEIAKSLTLVKLKYDFHEVVVAGMGGSGIGGQFVQSLIADESSIPLYVNKSYDLPAFVDENSLVIVSSYSGNTEESISAFYSALTRKATIVCLSSGGTLQSEAEINNIPFVALPPGSQSPRACLGYSIVLQLAILHQYGIIKHGILDQFLVASDLIKYENEEIKTKAKTIAVQLAGKLTVIYSADVFEPAAVRLRQQLNENAKVLCWHHTFPEMNHNELVGWVDKMPLAVVYLRTKDDLKKNAKRMDISKTIISGKTNTFIEIYAKGHSRAEKMVYFIHLADWISFFLAQIRGVDATEIKVIEFLKSELEKDSLG